MSIRVAFPFVGDTIGGSHISAALLMRELPVFGYAPVAVVHQDGPLTSWLTARGISILHADLPLAAGISGAGAAVRLAMIAPQLAMFLRRQGFALIHANDGRMITTWMPAARLAGAKAMAHRRTKWTPSRLAFLTLRMANLIVAISDFVRDGMPDDLRRSAVVIPNPFDFDIPTRLQARQVVIALTGADSPIVAADSPIVAFIGTLQQQKRPEIFLRAASVIRKTCPDARFLLVGRDGGMEAAMRRLAADIGLSSAITFAGFRTEVISLLAGCDLLLAPAVDEGHGRALIEAMACGIPIVAAASGGHCEIVRSGETGLLVQPDMPEALAAAAIHLIQAPMVAHDMTEAALAWAKATFSPHAHARAIAECYGRLLLG